MKRFSQLLLLLLLAACSQDGPIGPPDAATLALAPAKRPGPPPGPPTGPSPGVGPAAELAMVMTGFPTDGPAGPGDPFGFVVTVRNVGSVTAVTGLLNGMVSQDFATSWTVEGIAGIPLTCGLFFCGIFKSSPNGTDLVGPDLEPGEFYTVQFTASNDQGDCGTVTGSASVSSENAPAVQASASVTVVCPPSPPEPSLTIVKTAFPADNPVNQGDSFWFDITVRNTGTATAIEAMLTDLLPDFDTDWTFTSNDVFCIDLGTTFTCGVFVANPGGGEDFVGPDLEPGQSYTVRATASNDEGDCGTVTNTARVVAQNAPQVEDSASVIVICPPLPQ